MMRRMLILGLVAALACGDAGDGEAGAPGGDAAASGPDSGSVVTPPRSDPEPAPGLESPGAMVPAGGADVAPSFDCDRAEGSVEELICVTPELAALDRRLDSLWQQAMQLMEEGDMPEADRAEIRAWQRGWIEGRNDCWRSNDVERCVRDAYRMRIPELMAQWGLAPAGEPTFWSCEGNPANEFILTFFETEPPSVRVERGDRQEVMVQARGGPGTRYTGYFGREILLTGDSGVFVWPQTDTLPCAVRSRETG